MSATLCGADDMLCSVGFRKYFFWLGTVEHSCTLFWKTDENNKHQQRYFTLFHVVPSEGGAECPLNFSKTKQCIDLQEV